ncbi:MAG: hypothetical protein ACXWYS_07045 [Gaiellaceae bacterium]
MAPAEIARVLRLYAGPPHPRLRARAQRSRLRLAAAGVVVCAGAVACVAAAFALVGGSERHHAAIAPAQCTPSVVSRGAVYRERRATGFRLGRPLAQAVFRPCGGASTEVTVTSIEGIQQGAAVGVRGRPGRIFVAERCASKPEAALAACLRTPR